MFFYGRGPMSFSQINFEDEKNQIIGEISIRELRNFDPETVLDNYDYVEVQSGEFGSRPHESPKTHIAELTDNEKISLKISEFFYLISRHYYDMFTSGIIGPPGSKYSKFGVSETNFEVLAIKSIGKSLKFSPHIKKYHDFQNMILKSEG